MSVFISYENKKLRLKVTPATLMSSFVTQAKVCRSMLSCAHPSNSSNSSVLRFCCLSLPGGVRVRARMVYIIAI